MQEGDQDEDGLEIDANSLRLNNGAISATSGRAANLAHAALPNQADHQVDGIRPRVKTVRIQTSG